VTGVVMALLAAAAAVWVLAPLRAAAGPAGSGFRAGEQPEWPRAARVAVDDALRDLELDHATGKVSEDDYRLLRARYEGQAAEAGRSSRGSPV